MNRFTTNTSFRERTPNYIPLPFDQLYQVLQQKQQNYDAAEDLEIKAKSAVSALSSPVTGYQQYLDGVKENFLTQVMTLHKSTPDKGSSEYKRKLNELIAGVQSDRNLSIINEGNQAYAKYAEDRSNLLKNGKYYNWRDGYKTFKGIDDTGKITRFNYIGLKEGTDTEKLVKQAIDTTGKNVVEREFVKKDGTKIKQKVGGKSWQAIKANMYNTLGQEGLMDLMEKNGLKSEKELDKFLDISAKVSAETEDSYSQTYDFSLQKELRDRAAFDVEFGNNEQLIPLGDLPIPDMSNLSGKLDSFVDERGVPKNTNAPGALNFSDVEGINFYSSRNPQEQNKAAILKDENFGPIIENYRKLGLSVDNAIKQASVFVRTHGNKQPLKAVPLDFANKANAAEVKSATQFIEGGAGTLTFLDQKTGKPIDVDTKDGVKAVVFGRIGPTMYGNKGYLANVNGVPVIAAYNNIADSDAILDKQVYDVKYQGKPQKVENFQGHPDVKFDENLKGNTVELLLDLQGNVIAKPFNKRPL